MPNNRQVLVLVECDPMETRVAVLENGKVVDLEIEREPRIVEKCLQRNCQVRCPRN